MPTARINGAGIFYDEVGRGVPCIVLHGGLGYDHTVYRKGFGPLEDVFHLVYVDQRGNGRSPDAFFAAVKSWVARHP